MGKRKSKKGRSARNARKSLVNEEPEELVKAPHSFVFNRGRVGKHANELMHNFRKLMEPFTASDLKATKQNVLKDFVHIAGPLNVSHMVVFTKSEIAMYMKVIRLPRGPTLTFRIHEYCLSRDVISSSKKTVVYEKLFTHHPLLVLNNFSGDGLHFKLMTSMFQGMFPSININKTNLNAIRRCLLMNYNSDKTIEIRQYAIKIVPCGISKAVKKLIQSKVPDLGNYEDVSEFMMKSGNLSESEAEMDNALLNQIVLPQPISSRGNITAQKSAIRLYELGPRMKLQLIKIEEGIVTGDVLFHEFISKTPQEVAAIHARKQRQVQLKAQRRTQQEKNVKRKQQEKEKLKNMSGGHKIKDEEESNSDAEDRKWYQKEVGEMPDKDIMSHKRKNSCKDDVANKRMKFSNESNSVKEEKKKERSLQNVLAHRKKKKLAKLKKRNVQKKLAKRKSGKPKNKRK